jgi:hypothetical protein
VSLWPWTHSTRTSLLTPVPRGLLQAKVILWAVHRWEAEIKAVIRFGWRGDTVMRAGGRLRRAWGCWRRKLAHRCFMGVGGCIPCGAYWVRGATAGGSCAFACMHTL